MCLCIGRTLRNITPVNLERLTRIPYTTLKISNLFSSTITYEELRKRNDFVTTIVSEGSLRLNILRGALDRYRCTFHRYCMTELRPAVGTAIFKCVQGKSSKTPVAQGVAGSVRLLLTKNPVCFFGCPGCGVSFGRNPRPRQNITPLFESLLCLPKTKVFIQNRTNPDSILKKTPKKNNIIFFYIQKPTAYTGWFKNRISPPALRGETRCRQHINHISGEFLKVLLLSRICHVLPHRVVGVCTYSLVS